MIKRCLNFFLKFKPWSNSERLKNFETFKALDSREGVGINWSKTWWFHPFYSVSKYKSYSFIIISECIDPRLPIADATVKIQHIAYKCNLHHKRYPTGPL